MVSKNSLGRHKIHDIDGPRHRCTMRGCRKVISLREAQIMVCDEHALRVWAHIQRYKNAPDVIAEAAKLYQQKLNAEARADEDKRQRNRPSFADALKVLERVQDPEEIEAAERRMEEATYEDIYYVRIGDLIKIGYSGQLYGRLFSYGPAAQVLAHHPGTRADERDLHRSFRPFLAKGREWYHPAGILMDHIARVIEDHGEPVCVPEWTTPKEPSHALRRSSQAKPNGLSI